MAIKYETYKPCCLSLFNWERSVKQDKNGKNHYRVRDSSGAVYSHPGDCLSENDLRQRGIFLGLGLSAPLMVTLARIPLRIFSLFRGDFAQAAHKEALKEWHIERLHCAKAEKAHPGSGIAPSPHWFNFKVLLYSLRNLAIQIAQIAIYPLASIWLLFAGLWGAIVDPADGGKMWSGIELALLHGPFLHPKDCSPAHSMLRNVLMPCRLPIDVRRLLTLNEDSDLLRDKLNIIESKLLDNREILSGLGVNVGECLTFLHNYRTKALLDVSLHDENEMRNSAVKGGDSILVHSFLQHRHLCALVSYLSSIDGLLSTFDKIKGAFSESDWTSLTKIVGEINGVTLDSFVEPLRLDTIQPNSMTFYVQGIENEFEQHRDSLIKDGVEVDYILATIRNFVEKCKIGNQDPSVESAKYQSNKRFLRAYLAYLQKTILTALPSKERGDAIKKANSFCYTMNMAGDEGTLAVRGGLADEPAPVFSALPAHWRRS